VKKLRVVFILVLSISIITIIGIGAVNQFIATQVDYRIFLNGEEKQFTMPIVVIDNRTYVPLREVSENFGWRVAWNEEERSIRLNSNYIPDSDEFIEMMRTSQEGTLANGRRFRYIAQQDFVNPERAFSYEESLSDMRLVERSDIYFPSNEIIPYTIELTAEIAETYFQMIPHNISEKYENLINLRIFYDFENQMWFIITEMNEVPVTLHGAPKFTALTIRKIDGRITVYRVSPGRGLQIGTE